MNWPIVGLVYLAAFGLGCMVAAYIERRYNR